MFEVMSGKLRKTIGVKRLKQIKFGNSSTLRVEGDENIINLSPYDKYKQISTALDRKLI